MLNSGSPEDRQGKILTLFILFYYHLTLNLDQAIRIRVSIRQWPEGPGFSPSSSHIKKRYLVHSYLILSIIWYGSRVRGAIQGKKGHPPLHLSVVAIEKCLLFALDYGRPTYIYIYIY